MEERPISRFLHDEVYPSIDAVQLGLIDHLVDDKVKNKGRRPHYQVTCPLCQRRNRAFYYAGSSRIKCNRGNECGQVSTLWDAIQQQTGKSNPEMVEYLCDAAGVEPPNKQQNSHDAAAFSKAQKLKHALQTILPEFLFDDEEALAYLTDQRGFTKEEIESLGYGYLKSEQELEKRLKSAGADLDLAYKWGVLRHKDERNKQWAMEKRIIGLWQMPDGSMGMWGRIARPMQSGEKRKYLYSTGIDLTRPYRFHTGKHGEAVAVEGPLDADSLYLMGIPGNALGGASVNYNQAGYYAAHGVKNLVHITDADRAGQRGGVDTIKRCEPLGINTFIAMIGHGMDDPDAMRREGRHKEAWNLVMNADIGGTYLARNRLQALDVGGIKAANAYKELNSIYRELTELSRDAYIILLRRYGMDPEDPEVAAFRHWTALREAGLDADKATQCVRHTHGFELNVEVLKKSYQEREAANG